LRIVLLRNIPDEPSLRLRWNDLVLQMERPHVFYTCEWALALQSAYQPQNLLLFLGYDGEDLVGVACLSTDPHQQTTSFLTATTGDYCEFLSHPHRRAEFIEAVFNELHQLGVSWCSRICRQTRRPLRPFAQRQRNVVSIFTFGRHTSVHKQSWAPGQNARS
jgi:hypothetical protein